MNRPILGPDTKNCVTKECTAKCREGWEERDDHCYLWSSETQSWREAEEFCVKEAAHLASVTSKSTNDYILEGIGKRDVEFLWVGGSYRGLEGGWKWNDCRFGDLSNNFYAKTLYWFFFHFLPKKLSKFLSSISGTYGNSQTGTKTNLVAILRDISNTA